MISRPWVSSSFSLIAATCKGRIAATTSVVSAKIDYLPKMMNKHLIMLIIIYLHCSRCQRRCTEAAAAEESLVVLIIMVKR